MKGYLFSVLLSFIIPLNGCPSGWKGLKGSCYWRSSEEKSFPNAQLDCLSRGGNLTSVTNQQENNFVSTICRDGTFTSSTQGCWIGLNRTAMEFDYKYNVSDRRMGWKWLDEQEYSWMNWYSVSNPDSDDVWSEPNPSDNVAWIHKDRRLWYAAQHPGTGNTVVMRQYVCKSKEANSEDVDGYDTSSLHPDRTTSYNTITSSPDEGMRSTAPVVRDGETTASRHGTSTGSKSTTTTQAPSSAIDTMTIESETIFPDSESVTQTTQTKTGTVSSETLLPLSADTVVTSELETVSLGVDVTTSAQSNNKSKPNNALVISLVIIIPVLGWVMFYLGLKYMRKSKYGVAAKAAEKHVPSRNSYLLRLYDKISISP